jgi:Tol biopolymer transport system component
MSAAAGLLASLALAAGASPELVSSGPAGPGDSSSEQVVLSGTGRFAAFRSAATNLAPGAAESGEQLSDVFVRDRATGATVLASRPGPAGHAVDPAISADGRRVAFVAAPAPLELGNLYVADVETGRARIVRRGVPGYGTIWPEARPQLSADGRYVVFMGGSGPGREHLFVHDVERDLTVRVSRGPPAGFVAGPSISADGRYVAWSDVRLAGDATIVTVYRSRWRSRRRQQVERDLGPSGSIGDAAYRTAISANGRHVAYAVLRFRPELGRGRPRIVRRDLRTGRRTVVAPGRLAGMSADGRYVAYRDGLAAYVRDLRGGAPTRVAAAMGDLYYAPSISGDGGWIAFVAVAGELRQAFSCARSTCG